MTLHEEGDGVIHRRAEQLCPPALLLAQRIESPQSPPVALCRDDSLTTEDMGDATSEVIGSADMPRGDGDHVVTRRVDAEDGGVDVLILQEIAHGPDTDPEGGAEDQRRVLPDQLPAPLPQGRYGAEALRLHRAVESDTRELVPEQQGDLSPLAGDGEYGYILLFHFVACITWMGLKWSTAISVSSDSPVPTSARLLRKSCRLSSLTELKTIRPPAGSSG